MLTRHFDTPLPVQYLRHGTWHDAAALAVRRDHARYSVLITIAVSQTVERQLWVHRGRVRTRAR